MKTIGLIGGMSWESTVEYYRLINEEVKQTDRVDHEALNFGLKKPGFTNLTGLKPGFFQKQMFWVIYQTADLTNRRPPLAFLR